MTTSTSLARRTQVRPRMDTQKGEPSACSIRDWPISLCDRVTVGYQVKVRLVHAFTADCNLGHCPCDQCESGTFERLTCAGGKRIFCHASWRRADAQRSPTVCWELGGSVLSSTLLIENLLLCGCIRGNPAHFVRWIPLFEDTHESRSAN